MKNLTDLKQDHHFQVSVVKSAFRIIGCLIAMATGVDGLASMALMFILAELLGVADEIV